ncbi:MAG: hypothetical protein ABIZ91_06985 [Gemmatimonadaceae bacterium]
MRYSAGFASLIPAPPQAQARDASPSEVRDAVREAVRTAMQGTRDGLRDAGQSRGVLAQIAPPAPAVAPQAMIDAINGQIGAERANIEQLTSQLVNGTSNAREEVISSQIRASQDRLESLQSQLDNALGARSTREVLQNPRFVPGDMIPPQVKDISIAFFVMCAVIAIGIPLARAFGRRMDRKGEAAKSAPSSPTLEPRLDRIEQAIEAIAIEVERVSEGQRFTNKLMGEFRALPSPNPLEQWPKAGQKEAMPAAERSKG